MVKYWVIQGNHWKLDVKCLKLAFFEVFWTFFRRIRAKILPQTNGQFENITLVSKELLCNINSHQKSCENHYRWNLSLIRGMLGSFLLIWANSLKRLTLTLSSLKQIIIFILKSYSYSLYFKFWGPFVTQNVLSLYPIYLIK